MYESIKNFNKQFSYQPEIINGHLLKKKDKFLIIGMGGSALAPLILKTWKPKLDIDIHHDYGLPLSEKKLKDKLIIFSSYSGNTEEVLDAFLKAKENSLDMAVISTGGKLLSLAKENNVPYIQLPNTHTQPRMALGLSIKAFLKLIGEENELNEINILSEKLNPSLFEENGKNLAQKIINYIPIIYASNINSSLAYIWKIKLNETGKIPAFYNVLPELNHNEMTSFDITASTKEICEKFYFIILKDSRDDSRILKRIEVLEKLYKNRKLNTEVIEINKENIWEKIFSNILLADWASYYIAKENNVNPDEVPMVEEFKKLISE